MTDRPQPPIPVLGWSDEERQTAVAAVRLFLSKFPPRVNPGCLVLGFQELQRNDWDGYNFELYTDEKVKVKEIDHAFSLPPVMHPTLTRTLDSLENYFLEILARQVKLYLPPSQSPS